MKNRETDRPGNDATRREEIWRRIEGDDWSAYDQLPSTVRRRLMEHAYEPWAQNALHLWRHYKRVHGAGPRAERALCRYLDYCERLEQAAWAERHPPLPHVAACASVLRYGFSRSVPGVRAAPAPR